MQQDTSLFWCVAVVSAVAVMGQFGGAFSHSMSTFPSPLEEEVGYVYEANFSIGLSFWLSVLACLLNVFPVVQVRSKTRVFLCPAPPPPPRHCASSPAMAQRSPCVRSCRG